MSPSSTSSSEPVASDPVGPFVLRVIAFLAPLLALAVATSAWLDGTGELWPTERVLTATADARAGKQEVLYERGVLSTPMMRYKAAELRERKPEVVALGSSTSMQLRASLFGPYAERFYNAGGLVHHAEDLSPALDLLLEGGQARVVILPLDMWWFNATHQSGRRTPLLELVLQTPEPVPGWSARADVLRLLARRARQDGPRALLPYVDATSPVAGERGLGFSGRSGSGFRGSDGSRQYGPYLLRSRQEIRYHDDYDYPQAVREGRAAMAPGRRAAPERVAYLTSFLARCRAEGITVIGIVGAFATPVHQALAASPDHAGLLDSYRESMREAFAAADCALLDASHPSNLGLDDRYMVDGLHPSEVYMAHAFRALLDDPRVRAALPDLDVAHVQGLLDDPGTTPAELALD